MRQWPGAGIRINSFRNGFRARTGRGGSPASSPGTEISPRLAVFAGVFHERLDVLGRVDVESDSRQAHHIRTKSRSRGFREMAPEASLAVLHRDAGGRNENNAVRSGPVTRWNQG